MISIFQRILQTIDNDRWKKRIAGSKVSKLERETRENACIAFAKLTFAHYRRAFTV